MVGQLGSIYNSAEAIHEKLVAEIAIWSSDFTGEGVHNVIIGDNFQRDILMEDLLLDKQILILSFEVPTLLTSLIGVVPWSQDICIGNSYDQILAITIGVTDFVVIQEGMVDPVL